MGILTCPHCRGQIKYFGVNESKGQFESTVPFSAFGSFWHRVVKNRPLVKSKVVKTFLIQSEIKASPHQILLRELEIPADEPEMKDLADVYLRLDEDWSRDNSTSNTCLTQPKYNSIKEAFIKLGFLEQVNSRKYTLTEGGKRFLRHFL